VIPLAIATVIAVQIVYIEGVLGKNVEVIGGHTDRAE
jgi:hypothetical protein